MNSPYKIAVAGIGGVGGFYGGRLAAFYHRSKEVEINFIARGANLEAIRRNGMELQTDNGSLIAHPHHVTDDPAELGELDLILLCCKTFDLEQFAAMFSGNISDRTYLLPLLNGVDSTYRLQTLFPHARNLYGCVYLISRIISPGVVQASGNVDKLLFGSTDAADGRLDTIERIFTDAGIRAGNHRDIQLKIWEKFSFISPLASLTSYYNCSIGKLLEEVQYKQMLLRLSDEVYAVATGRGIGLPGNTIENNIKKMSGLPYEATSSMHIDFLNHRRTEMDNLTGFVVREAARLGIDVPGYEEVFEGLKSFTPASDNAPRE